MRNRKLRKDLTMMNGKTILLLMAGLIGFLGGPALGFADGQSWDAHMSAGNQLAAQGRYDEAEAEFLNAAAEANGFGPHDTRLATSLNNLASLYQGQGKYIQAELLYQQSLGCLEVALGPEHPFLTAALTNLAWLYYATAQYERAEPLYRRSLAIIEKASGPEHPSSVEVLNNLGALLVAQGRYAEAEPLFLRSLAIREKTVGPEHVELVICLRNYAELLRKTNREKEAIAVEGRVEAILKKRGDATLMNFPGESRELRETTVQIMGRSCEYDAAEIEETVRRFAAVEEIRFFHERGKVLIRYQAGMASPEQLVEAVERALVMGWNCHARIARGG
jgi:tetratricopeptide (TPR) repeat protein